VTTLTKTLELKLVEPNAHKRRKLRETREAYQQALHDAFDAGCTTQTEANDVVVNYKLSGYAKNALRSTSRNSRRRTTQANFTMPTPSVSRTKGYDSTTSPRTLSSGTSKSRTTRTTTSGCQHNRIPNNGTGWKR